MTSIFLKSTAASVATVFIATSAFALDVGVGASVGGVGVGAGASVGHGSVADAGVGASVGGVGAGAGASVGGDSVAGVGAGVSVGNTGGSSGGGSSGAAPLAAALPVTARPQATAVRRAARPEVQMGAPPRPLPDRKAPGAVPQVFPHQRCQSKPRWVQR